MTPPLKVEEGKRDREGNRPVWINQKAPDWMQPWIIRETMGKLKSWIQGPSLREWVLSAGHLMTAGGFGGNDRGDNDPSMNTEFEARFQVCCVKATLLPQTSVLWSIDRDRWQPPASCSRPVGPGQ